MRQFDKLVERLEKALAPQCALPQTERVQVINVVESDLETPEGSEKIEQKQQAIIERLRAKYGSFTEPIIFVLLLKEFDTAENK